MGLGQDLFRSGQAGGSGVSFGSTVGLRGSARRGAIGGRTWTSHVALEIVLFKDDLIVVLSYVGQVEHGFRQE